MIIGMKVCVCLGGANRNQGLWKNGAKITRWKHLRQSNKDQPGSRYPDGTAGVNEHSCCSPYVVNENCAARGRVFMLQHATHWHEQPIKKAGCCRKHNW
jgi:hypothetical protein